MQGEPITVLYPFLLYKRIRIHSTSNTVKLLWFHLTDGLLIGEGVLQLHFDYVPGLPAHGSLYYSTTPGAEDTTMLAGGSEI